MLQIYQLIEFLLGEQVKFHTDSLGQDPLHVALNTNWYVADLTKLEETVDSLMRFQPPIDVYHLRRMKLIHTFYPVSYERIVKKHPELMVTGEIGLPSVYLN